MQDSRPVSTAVVTELLSVIATRSEVEEIAGYLIFAAMGRGLLAEPPRLSIEPDWADSCGLLELWSAEHEVPPSGLELPAGVGIWRIRLAFTATGTDEQIEAIGFAGMAQAVEDCLQHTGRSESISTYSPSEGVYYFSLVNVPPSTEE
ncbi:hypothetical protein [Arsenicicoccus dermatophilus]|uniref:hypothetical protein n=1 Tax=Arsenicicoccus dermatophilus TaxID=1076331 RepID=UPI003916E908